MEIIEKDYMESLYIHNATVSDLARYLNPNVPWVWILGHLPNRIVEWWDTSIPINKQGASVKAKARSIIYDLMLETKEFLELVPEFEDHGLVLIQSHQRMPDTFDLSRIPENQQTKVLRDNGAFLRMYLPHAIETAQIQCFEKGYLKTICT
jgi:hypothetical protein